MRTCVLGLLGALLLASCGNEEEIASKKSALEGLRTQFKHLNAEKAEKSPGWQEIKNGVIPARNELKRAERASDESATAAAQEKFGAAQAAASAVIEEEKSLTGRIRGLQDEIDKLEKEIRRLGGKP